MLNIDEKGTIGERITQLIEYFTRGNKAAFGRAAGLQSGLLAGIIGTRMSKPSFEVLQKILTGYSSVSADWLLFGHGDMLASREPTPVYEETYPHMIPDKGDIKIAGQFISSDIWEHDKQRWEQWRHDKAQHERIVAMVKAFGEYLAKKDNSPEFRLLLDMMTQALAPPLTIGQEDALDAEEHERYNDTSPNG